MKKFCLTIATLIALVFAANAQFATGPRIESAFSVATPYKINMIHNTTNIASPHLFRISGGSVNFYSDLATTNTLGSNIVFRFQLSADSIKWVNEKSHNSDVDGTMIQCHFQPLTTSGGILFTQLLSAANASGWNWIKLHSISNSGYAGGVLSNCWWITNAWFTSEK